MNLDNVLYPAPKQEYKVLVRCNTFNQSKYIEDALNGFAMQQTDFPFVCLIMDDASTDGEQEVIKEWMERECDMSRAEIIDIPTSIVIIVPHKTNSSCTFAFYLLKHNLYKNNEEKIRHVTPWREKCKYEAICEGDDYWIDPLKLQMQVNFMDKDPQISLCYTRNEAYSEELDRITAVRGIDCVDFRTFLIYDETITLTAMMRTSQLMQYIEEIKPDTRGWLMGDTPLWLWLAKHGKICPIDVVTARYVAHAGSASRTGSYERQIQFYKSALEIRLFFIDLYNDCVDLIPSEYDRCYRMCMIVSYEYKKFRGLLENFTNIKCKKFSDFILVIKFWIRVLLK